MDEQDKASEPVEGDDAGPAQEYWANWHLERVRSAHERASNLADAARDALGSSPEKAEGLARQALTESAHAYWFAAKGLLAQAPSMNIFTNLDAGLARPSAANSTGMERITEHRVR